MKWNKHHNNWDEIQQCHGDYDISCEKVWTKQVHTFTETCARFMQRDMSGYTHNGNKVTILKVKEETRCARGGHYCGCDISHSKNWTYKSFRPGHRGSLSSQQFTMLIIQRHSGCSPISWYYCVSIYSIQTSSLC